MHRRTALQSIGLLAAAPALLAQSSGPSTQTTTPPMPPTLKGNIRHSVARWCFGKIPNDVLFPALKELGVGAVDLVSPSEFPVLLAHGFVCAMVNNPTIDGLGGIGRAWNRLEHHEKLVKAYEQRLEEVAAAGFERLVCFSGNRNGLDDETGLANCAAGLRRIMPAAERLKVTVCMELLNSKVNHKDYQCDHTEWGVELVKRVGSERFKLLYDIYHMQIMEGDLCATIQRNHEYIGHYHTAGVPGRNEIDDSQEINYPAVMRAILATGFKGYVAQEFTAKRPDALASLRQSFAICDV